jgi:hypothetical protein
VALATANVVHACKMGNNALFHISLQRGANYVQPPLNRVVEADS